MSSALELRGLTVHYKRFTLGPLDFDLQAGRVVGLVGPNGSGKTTTLRCVAGNLYPDAGRIAVNGKVAAHDDGSWKEQIGYVPDRPCFFDRMTAGGFLRFVAGYYPDWSDELAASLSDRFRLDLAARIMHLSAGNRMKLSMVAALAHRPRLALFDEPTAGLDPIVRGEVFDVVWELMETGNMTVLYSTHIIDDLYRLADDLVFLHDGHIRLQAAKDDLIDRWRRIRFGLDRELPGLDGVIRATRTDTGYEIITSDGAKTLERLSNLGAIGIQVQALTLDEIAIFTMKGSGEEVWRS
jgi:ABC-2 type transport system ATP-binding protein